MARARRSSRRRPRRTSRRRVVRRVHRGLRVRPDGIVKEKITMTRPIIASAATPNVTEYVVHWFKLNATTVNECAITTGNS